MAATYPDASWAGISPNKTKRTKKIKYFIIHHWASTRAAVGQRDEFMRANARRVSPNWMVLADGQVWEIVPPDNYRAWTTGTIDHEAVTVETQNESGAPDWGISPESMESIAQLVAWAHRRWGIKLDRAHVFGHRERGDRAGGRYGKAPTACPGPSMDLDWIVARARQIVGQGGSIPAPKPGTAPKPATPAADDGKLAVDGDLGVDTIRDLQEALGTPVDGVISKPYSDVVAELQRRLNKAGARDWDGKPLKVDGVGLRRNHTARVPLAGRWRTIWALQDYLGTTKDGVISRRKSEVIKELQRRLNAGNLF